MKQQRGVDELASRALHILTLVDSILTYDVNVPTTCCEISEGGNFVAMGGNDGKIRLLDSRFRSNRVYKTLDAHSGTVSDLVIDEQSMTMLSCGMISRKLNPYDPQSPITYHPDKFVRVYDLRMMRNGQNLGLSIPPPLSLKILPSTNSGNDDRKLLMVYRDH